MRGEGLIVADSPRGIWEISDEGRKWLEAQPYAQPGGKTESVVREALGWGKAVHTLDSPANAHLLALGVQRWDMLEQQRKRNWS